jgi:hypothetical protein
MTQLIRVQNLKNRGDYDVKVLIKEHYSEDDGQGNGQAGWEVVETIILKPGEETEQYVYDIRQIEIVEINNEQ